MKKRLFALVSVLSLILILASNSYAVEIAETRQLDRFTDAAGLLTASEAERLKQVLDEISERQEFDVAILAVNEIPDGYSVSEYADDTYDSYGFGFGVNRDGCLLVISMEERDWYISTCGYGITAFTDAGIDYLGEAMISSGLSSGNYASAFRRFATECDLLLNDARAGEPYDITAPSYRQPSSSQETEDEWVGIITISLFVGLVVAIVGILILRHGMKSVAVKGEANQYIVPGSLALTDSRDLFLYSTVSRTRRQTESSSNGGSSIHTSSSGSSHGGGGGKF